MSRYLPYIITTILIITVCFAIWGKKKTSEIDIKPGSVTNLATEQQL